MYRPLRPIILKVLFMKTLFALALLAITAWTAPAMAQVTAAGLVGDYEYTGTETDASKYDGAGALKVTMDKSGALEVKWDGGKYVGIGQVAGSQMFVGSVAEGKVVIMVMDVKPDGTLDGKWWRRTDAGTKGTEVWKKK
jgi:hypothetical protein